MDTKAAYDHALDKIVEASLDYNRSRKDLSYIAMEYVADILAHKPDYLLDLIDGPNFAETLRAFQAQVQLTGEEQGELNWNRIMPAILGQAIVHAIQEDFAERRKDYQLERMRMLPLDREPVYLV